MSGAVQLVLQTDLSAARSWIPLLVNNESGAYANGASQMLHATVTERAGRIQMEATITDIKTQQNQSEIQLDGDSASGLLPLLNSLAKRLDGNAVSFSTSKNAALQAYVMAASAPNAQQRVAPLTDAISLDPSFGLAYIALADVETQIAPQSLPALLQAADSHKASFTPLDRARFSAFYARFSHAPLSQQENDFRAVLQIAPNEADALTTLGSLSFLSGNKADGSKYLERALELNPSNLNIRLALANGLFQTRQFAAAEKILVGMDNNPAILPQLAVCVLLEGDVARANTIADRLVASISNADVKILFRAVWLKLSGQSQKAVNLLKTATFSQPSAQAIALSEVAVWQMMANDFSSARQSAAQAQQLDPKPLTFGSIVALLARANGPADVWQQQVNSSFLAQNDSVRSLVLAYGLFLGGHYAESTDAWQTILQKSGEVDLRARAMLAASLIRQGKADQANRINVQPFVPEFGDLYAAVSFYELNRDLGIGVR